MAKILISPGKYVQGAGELNKIGEYASAYGKKALVLISAGGQKRSGALIQESFAKTDIAMEFATFNGECSKTEIQRLQGVSTPHAKSSSPPAIQPATSTKCSTARGGSSRQRVSPSECAWSILSL